MYKNVYCKVNAKLAELTACIMMRLDKYTRINKIVNFAHCMSKVAAHNSNDVFDVCQKLQARLRHNSEPL